MLNVGRVLTTMSESQARLMFITALEMCEPQTRNVTMSEPHSGNSSVIITLINVSEPLPHFTLFMFRIIH